MLNEIKSKRTYNSKHFDNGDGTFTMKSHVGHIHYFNKLKEGDGEIGFREIDFKLVWDKERKGWTFKFHNFQPFLPKFADEWVEFRDVFQGKDQTIKYRAKCKHVKGRIVESIDCVTDANAVIYDDAFGDGLDYVLYFTRSCLKKVVRIRDKKKETKDYVFDFDVQFPDEKKIIRSNGKGGSYELDKAKGKVFDTEKQTLIGNQESSNEEWFTYLRPFVAWYEQTTEIIETEILVEENSTILRKKVPSTFIEKSKGDVFTDTTTSYYAGAGDGRVSGQNNSWATVRSASVGNTGADPTGTTWFLTHDYSSPNYRIWRCFFPIDTSVLPDDATITAASFYNTLNANSSGNTNIGVLVGPTSQASNTTLVTDDFDQCGTLNSPTELAPRVTFSGRSAGDSVPFVLNSSGLSTISKTGYTLLGIRGANDVDNTTPSVILINVALRLSEYTGTASDPYLEVTYTVGGNAFSQAIIIT